MKKLVALLLVLVLSLGLAACGQTAATTAPAADTAAEPAAAPAVEPRVLKITIAHSEGSPCVESLKRFCEELKERTNGELTAEVYTSTQLAGGNQTTAIEMIQSGEIEMGVVSSIVECAIIPSLNIIEVPFLWNSEAETDVALTRGSDAFNMYYDEFAAKDLVLLGFAESGFREITNDVREIKTPEDMTNLKIRVLGNNMLNAAYTKLGANPTDYNFNELYTALQQKTVDGQENPISTIIIPQKYCEVQDYLTICRMVYEAQVVQVGKVTWDSLTAEQQEILQELIDEFVVYEKENNRACYEADVQSLVDYGMNVNVLTEDEVAAFRTAVQDVVDEYVPQFSQDIYDTIMASKS